MGHMILWFSAVTFELKQFIISWCKHQTPEMELIPQAQDANAIAFPREARSTTSIGPNPAQCWMEICFHKIEHTIAGVANIGSQFASILNFVTCCLGRLRLIQFNWNDGVIRAMVGSYERDHEMVFVWYVANSSKEREKIIATLTSGFCSYLESFANFIRCLFCRLRHSYWTMCYPKELKLSSQNLNWKLLKLYCYTPFQHSSPR